MIATETIADPRLALLYRHWLSKRHGRAMPTPADIDLDALPASVRPNTMLLEVLRQDEGFRFRYRRIGSVFWRGAGREPVGRFLDEALPETAGYRAYVIGIYEEMAQRRQPMYTENSFILLHGEADPMATKRVSLPLSSDGVEVDMVLAGHVFDYGSSAGDNGLLLVTSLREGARRILED